MEFTGERMIPGRVDKILLQEHVARYKFALDYSGGRKVLDAACGAGYGSYILASNAKQVIGIDISDETIDFANGNFSRNNTEYITSSVLDMPFDDDSFELSIAFEIFEHIDKPVLFLNELKRVTKKKGKIILSTPNESFTKSTVDNPFHTHEYTYDEFSSMISSIFTDDVEYIGQNVKSKTGGLKQIYMKIKHALGIGPLFKKQTFEISNADDLISLHTPYYFSSDDLIRAEFFIAVVTV